MVMLSRLFRSLLIAIVDFMLKYYSTINLVNLIQNDEFIQMLKHVHTQDFHDTCEVYTRPSPL